MTNLQNSEYPSEIARQENRLKALRSEVADLEREKGIQQTDIERLTKHLTYLEELEDQKDLEIARKQNTIDGLDAQIEDKSHRHDELQSEIGELATILEDGKERLIATVNETSAHDERMVKERAEILKHKKEAEENALYHHETVTKLRQFLNELN